jgi:hypothetical protein
MPGDAWCSVNPLATFQRAGLDRPARGLDGMGPVTGARNERRSVAGRAPAPSPADQARRWVDQTCSDQGLPSKVMDQGVLSDIAVLLGAGSDWSLGSNPPAGRHPAWIEDVAAPDGGSDNNRVEEGRDDRSLTGGGEGVPLAS